jgi:hypothetical protein
VPGKEDVYKIENRNSGLVLDDEHGETNPPAPVKQYPSWEDDGRQQWKLITVSTPATPAPATPAPATPAPAPSPALRTGQVIALRADNGMYLSRIRRGSLDPIEAAKGNIDTFCQFTVTVLGNGQIVLQADNGMYLSRIRRGSLDPIEAAKGNIDIHCQFALVTLN